MSVRIISKLTLRIMTKAEKILGIGVLIAIVIAVGAYVHKSEIVREIVNAGAVATTDITASNFTEVTASNGMLISAGGLTVTAGGISSAGVTETMARSAFAYTVSTATGTICSLASPAATSTLVSATVNITTASSTVEQIVIAKGSTAFATTTALTSAQQVPASGMYAFAASSSPSGGGIGYIIAPSTYINVSDVTTGSGVGPNYPTGVCTAVFRTVN